MRFGAIVLVGASFAVSCSASDDPAPESTATSSEAVINGIGFASPNNLYGVAVYNGGARPCSGTVLNANGWVLTTRKCVTDAMGNLLPPGTVRLSRAISPGPTVPADAVTAGTMLLHPTSTIDLALVNAPAIATPTVSWPLPVSITDRGLWDGYGVSLYLGAPSTLTTPTVLSVAASGYGLSSLAAFFTGNNSSAGTLRWKALQVSSPNDVAGTYQLLNASDGGQVFEGDQGGASFGFPTACPTCVPFPWTLFGTHTGLTYTRAGTSPSTDTAVFAGAAWITQTLGMTIENARRASADGQRLLLDTSGGLTVAATPTLLEPYSEHTTLSWSYDPSTKRITSTANPAMCLEVQGGSSADDTPVQINTCAAVARQQWTFSRSGAIVNANGKCVSASAGSAPASAIVIRTCATSGDEAMNQQWVARVAELESTDYTTYAGPYTTAYGTATTNVEWRVIRYTSQGMPNFALMCKPTVGSAPFPTQIMNHGGGTGTTTYDTIPVPFHYPANDFDVCVAGAQVGWVTVYPSYRGEPLVTPDPSVANHDVAYVSAGTPEVCLGEVDDVLRLNTLLNRHTELVDTTRTAMLGMSHGGCITTRAVQRGADVKRAVDISGPSSWTSLYTYCQMQPPGSLCATLFGTGLDPWLVQQIGAPPGAPTGSTLTNYDWRSTDVYGSQLAARTTVRYMKIHGVDDPLVVVAQACDPAIVGSSWGWWHLTSGGTPTNTAVTGCTPPSGWSLAPIDYSGNRDLVVQDGMQHLAPVTMLAGALGMYSSFVTSP